MDVVDLVSDDEMPPPKAHLPPVHIEPGELEIEGVVNTLELPHARTDCTRFPFRGPHANKEERCNCCFCFVCDANAASCPVWEVHCQAFGQGAGSKRWKELRRQAQVKRLAEGNFVDPGNDPEVSAPVDGEPPVFAAPAPAPVRLHVVRKVSDKPRILHPGSYGAGFGRGGRSSAHLAERSADFVVATSDVVCTNRRGVCFSCSQVRKFLADEAAPYVILRDMTASEAAHLAAVCGAESLKALIEVYVTKRFPPRAIIAKRNFGGVEQFSPNEPVPPAYQGCDFGRYRCPTCRWFSPLSDLLGRKDDGVKCAKCEQPVVVTEVPY